MEITLSGRSQIFIVLLSLFIASLAFIYPWLTNKFLEVPDEEYDFIIVGSGSAGSILGRRLSENGSYKVLVLEAGEEESFLSTIPFLAPSLQQTYCNWNYMTESQKYSQRGLNDRRSSWPRGMCLGGSGTINYMMHSWSPPEDVNYWNLTNWTFDKVYPFFKKMETFHSANGAVQVERGKNGPIHVTEFNPNTSELAQAFLNAAGELGAAFYATPGQAAINNGKRSSSAVEILRPALRYPNLHVVVNALVIKVLFTNGAANGVEVIKLNSKTRHIVRCKREIILSAGSVGTPHLLMLSGIGPKDILEEFDIPLQRHHPKVGKHLQDHLLLPMYVHLEKPVSCNAAKIKRVQEILSYFVKRQGYLSWNGVEATLRTTISDLNSTRKDMYAMLFNMGSVNQMFSEIANYDFEAFQNLFPQTKNESKEGFVLMPYCSRPWSEGHITLKSPFPSEPPLIDPKYLSNKDDVKCLVSAARLMLKLLNTKPFKDLGASIHKPTLKCPPHVKHSLTDNSFMECWIRTAAITTYHPVGTCRMGDEIDDVVDQQFRVKGIEGLRIIDSSVLPTITSGPPNALIMVLAERGSQFILEEHNKYKTI